jgi:hypothetical protein
MRRGLVIRGITERELYSIGFGLPENVIVHGEVVSVHIGMGHGQVKTVTHAAELEISR